MDWASLPPLAALRAFAAFADTGNVQAAGAALNVSHAAISQQLRALEDHLGLTLLDRTGRALRLTADGQVLADAALEGFGAMARIVQALTGAEATRPLHITTTNSFAANWLMPRLSGLRAAHPELDIVIDPNPARIDPKPGEVDLAIRYGEGDWPGLDCEKLMPSPIVVVAAPSLVGATPPEDLASLAHLTWFQEPGTSEASEWLQAHGLRLAGGLVTVPNNLAIDAARAGQGVTITASVSVQADIDSGRLICLYQERQDGAYYLVTHSGVKRPPLRHLLKWLRAEVKRSTS